MFGIDGVWCWGFGDMPERIERLKKVFASFNNAILISTFNGSKPFVKMLYDLLGTERLYVDSVDYSIPQYQINANRVTKEHPHLKRPKDRRLHMSLYALAAAKSRSFMYDCYNVANDDEKEPQDG